MINLVNVISTSFNSLNQRIVKILRYGKKDIQEPWEAAPFGMDSNPIKGMVAIYAPTMDKGKSVIIGYLNQDQLAGVGENRLFSTDEDGNLSFYVWLKGDGTVEVGGDTDNMVRYSELKSGFDELKSDFNSLVAKFNSHIHPAAGIDSITGAPVTVTVTPTATSATASTADISGSKIDEVKTI